MGKDPDGKEMVFTEFDCPNCDANNPYDEGFRDRDEIRCYYCGTMYRVKVLEGSKRFRLREL